MTAQVSGGEAEQRGHKERQARDADADADTHSPVLLGKEVRSVIESLLLRTHTEQSRHLTAAEPGSIGDDPEPSRKESSSENRRPKPTIMAADGWRPGGRPVTSPTRM